MIELTYCLNSVFIYNVDDWLSLRKNHRIIGEIVGNIACIPSLPLKLLPEEVALLLQLKVAKLVATNTCNDDDDNNMSEKYKEFEVNLFEQQQQMFKVNRKRQLEGIIHQIVSAKRKCGNTDTVEQIFEKEFEKSSTIIKEHMIWPILLRPLDSSSGCLPKIVDENVFLSKIDLIKFTVYKDLWQKGYYITQGHKFGGDFLVYLGDPIVYHAIFIVRCVKDPNKEINPSEIVAFGRLGTSVRKRAVLASCKNDNQVSYITINWLEA